MKSKKQTLPGLILIVGLALFTTLSTLPARAGDVIYKTVTLGTGQTLLTNTTVTANGTPFAITPNADLAFFPTTTGAGVGTSNVIFSIQLSPDATDYTTTTPLSLTNALTGTTLARGYIFVSRTNLYGTKWARVSAVSTTQTNGVTVGLKYSQWY